jgi:hypothetical protein
MNPFTIDRTDLDEAAKLCRTLVVISLFGAIVCIGAYFIGGL